MDKLKNKLADLLAYPVRFYQSLSDKRATLFAGIILVGAIDLLLPDIAAVFDTFFSGKPTDDILFNAFMMVFVILAAGIIDVVFLSVPLFDFFKFLKKREIAMETFRRRRVSFAYVFAPARAGQLGKLGPKAFSCESNEGVYCFTLHHYPCYNIRLFRFCPQYYREQPCLDAKPVPAYFCTDFHMGRGDNYERHKRRLPLQPFV
ncbi:MAG: hypothetical protein ACOX4M_02710 [Acetivibrionales bacterium]